MKMHLFEKFKIDALGTSQGRYTKDGFSGCFEDVPRTFLQNYKNKQRLAFKVFHATHLVSRIENDATVKCFVLRLKLTSWGHPKDATMQTSLQNAVRTSFGGTLKLYFKNIIVINFIQCVKLTFSGRP